MFAHRSVTLNGRKGRNASFRRSFLLLSAALVLLVGLVGCGNNDSRESTIPSGDILATVNGTDITSRDYEESLAKLLPNQLPLDDGGAIHDMASEAGKAAYLEIMVNRSALAHKATKLGYGKEADVEAARDGFLNGLANKALWVDVVQKPTENISEEELQDLYSKLGTQRECLFLLTNYEEQALAARKRATDGDDWDDLVAEFHNGIKPPAGLGTTNVVYGYTDAFFDEAVFAVGVGEVTEPIYTGTGYWLLKVVRETEGKKPDFETNKPTILDIAHRRKVEGVRLAFREEMRASHKLIIDEDVLVVAYNGLDPLELGRDPRTGKVKPQAELKPLKISSKDLDRVFYSYVIDGKKIEATLGEYKQHFDRMGGFQRPVYAGMVGGMRNSIIEDLERSIITDEARIRGYFDDPEVLREVNIRLDEMLVSRLMKQAISYNEEVDPELIVSYYREHKGDYNIPQKRDGRLVICRDEATATQAGVRMDAGKPWATILTKLGTDPENKSKDGLVTFDTSDSRPRAKAMFSLDVGQRSQPFAIGDGRFGVVTLLEIHKARPAEVEEVNYTIGKQIRQKRENEAITKFIDSVRAESKIQIFQDKLAGLPSYEEATLVDAPQNVVSGS